MNEFIFSCKRGLNPWVIGIIAVVVITLIIFVPILGIASLLAVLPIIGCAVMCGGMAFMMNKGKRKR